MQKKKSDNKIAITYTPIGKGTPFLKELIKTIPPQFRATNKTSYIFSTIFTIVIIIGVINSLIPLMDIDLSFDPNKAVNETKTFELNINVGIPLSFFGSDTKTGSKLNMSPKNLLIDLIFYLFIAYLIDVLINFIITLKLIPSKEELNRRPKEIQIQKKSISEKATEKIIEKVTNKITEKKATEKKLEKNQPQQPTNKPSSPTNQTTLQQTNTNP